MLELFVAHKLAKKTIFLFPQFSSHGTNDFYSNLSWTINKIHMEVILQYHLLPFDLYIFDNHSFKSTCIPTFNLNCLYRFSLTYLNQRCAFTQVQYSLRGINVHSSPFNCVLLYSILPQMHSRALKMLKRIQLHSILTQGHSCTRKCTQACSHLHKGCHVHSIARSHQQ